jgi:hypothetical protein
MTSQEAVRFEGQLLHEAQVRLKKLERDNAVLLEALSVLAADGCVDTLTCPSMEPDDRCSSCVARDAIAQAEAEC